MKSAQTIIVAFGLIVVIGAWRVFSPDDHPDFERILTLSGITFEEKPVLVQWNTRNSGPFLSNQVTQVEFRVSDADAKNLSRCEQPGFSRGTSPANLTAFDKHSRNSESVCWRRIESDGTHHFIAFGKTLAYLLIIN